MRRLKLMIGFALLVLSCVDPVDLSLPPGNESFIIEGHVKDYSTPDTIWLSKSFPVDGKLHSRIGVPGAKLWITDSDASVVDTLIDLQNGIYVTGAFQGAVGRSYFLEGKIPVKLPDGSMDTTTFVSTVEQMLPAGTIDSIYYEQTSKVNPDTELAEPGLNIFVDATVNESSSHRLRWKFSGTYIFQSDPAALELPIPGTGCLGPGCPTAPPACATNCECCICWASEREDTPLVTNPSFLGGTKVNRVFMKYIPINGFTFSQKYRVEIAQMELSKPVFDFYSAIRKQMDNASSLFQPPFFELGGNVSVTGGSTRIIGIFSAAAEGKRVRYLYKGEVAPTVGATVLPGDCRVMAENATNIKPPFWN